MNFDCRTRIRQVFWTVCLAIGWFSTQLLGQEVSRQHLDDFERDVRPILIRHCFSCHGEEKQESGLRVDSRAALLDGGDRGPAVVPGNADKSLLIRAISYDTDDLAMPPEGKLAEDQVRHLRHWVEQQAPWPADEDTPLPRLGDDAVENSHWAFQPIVKPALPVVHDRSWPANPIDCFILAKLEEAGLEPSPRASARVLLRRAHFDLIGLPPAWAADSTRLREQNGSGWEALIDRLLAQREYGERWARHWLDVARYADTKGYLDGGQVQFVFSYTYRDYVVRALNEDLPFDQFVVDQIAADHLTYSRPQRWRLAGMGFLTIGRRFNNNDHDIIDDRIDVISRGLQGMTVTCARCHDHKYDPISTEDYYALYGIFASSFEPTHADLPVLGDEPATDRYREYVRELAKQNDQFRTEFNELHEKIKHELRAYAGDYLVYLVRESPRHRDQSQNPLKTDRTILRGPAAYGFGAIRRWRRFIASRSIGDPVFGVWLRMESVKETDFSSELQTRLSPGVNRVLLSRLRQAKPRTMIDLARVYGAVLEEAYRRWTAHHNAEPNSDHLPDNDWEQVRQVLYGPGTPPDMTAYESIDCYSLDEHTHMRGLIAKIEKVSIEHENAPSRAMVLRRRERPYDPVVFLRGQPNRTGKRVSRRIPDVFRKASAPPRDNRSADDRLSLARSIIAPTNTLTARVIVNRVWQWHFGAPLVGTPSDFGLRSAPPLHVDLLDYLAAWLIENDWSLKQLHRLIMTSNTYQQSSVIRPEGLAADPENRLLWRYIGRRLEWEVIRDSLLAASGRLIDQSGGRPIDLAPDDPQSRCRTIYLKIDRQEISRFARHYDFPAPDFTSPGRPRTTVPQQQLFFLNSPFVIQQARTLGKAAASLSEASDREKFDWLHRRILGRESNENSSDLELLRRNVSFTSDENKFWSVVAHGLLQSNEFIYVE